MFPSQGSMPSSEASQRQYQIAASPHRATNTSQDISSPQINTTPQSTNESYRYAQKSVSNKFDMASIDARPATLLIAFIQNVIDLK